MTLPLWNAYLLTLNMTPSANESFYQKECTLPDLPFIKILKLDYLMVSIKMPHCNDAQRRHSWNLSDLL